MPGELGRYGAGGQVPDVDEHQGDVERCPVHPGCRHGGWGLGDPAPAAPSLAAGAIARGLADSIGSRYRAQLDELWKDVLAEADYGPWDD